MQLHPSTKIVDSSKLQEFMECPRKYFYRHVLGWSQEESSHALFFGTVWHSALEQLWINGFDETALEIAKATFLTEYREKYDEISDEIYFPKSPYMAAEALEDYQRMFQREAEEWQVLFTEISITVPILNGHVLSGRMDLLCENINTKQKKVREYKTTGRYDRQWRDQWLLSTQIGTYTHTLYSLYPAEEVYGVTVEGAIFQKKGVQVQPIPCRRTPEQMLSWLTSTTSWFDRLQADLDWLEATPYERLEALDVLPVFPLNSQSCTKYYGCQYHDFCSAWANPLQHISEDEVPLGFVREFWDPNERESKVTFNLKEE